MQELRLVAVSEDGAFLVLASTGRGTRFMLPVDDRLRAAVRGQFSRLGQFEIEVENPLRPKEIQARIRSGETAEAIAELSGLPIDRVRWFEGPVLQEREYMAQQAQRAVVRTPGETTPGPTLGDLVAARIGQTQMDSGDAVWDSWKREDNTWRVRLAYSNRGEDLVAHWSYDPRRRSVAPQDEEAARFSSPDADEEPAETNVAFFQPRRPAEPRVPAEPAPARRPVQSDSVGPLAPPPIPLIDGPSVAPLPEERPSAEHPAPTSTAEREVDTERVVSVDVPPVTEPPAEVAPPVPEPEPAPTVAEDAPPAVEPHPDPEAVESPPAEPAAEAPAPAKRARAPITAAAAGTKTAAAATGDGPAPRRQRAKGRGRRASVPSWDEIMFGSRKSE